jgi:hypothetical protein
MCTCRDHGPDTDALDFQGGYYVSSEIVYSGNEGVLWP